MIREVKLVLLMISVFVITLSVNIHFPLSGLMTFASAYECANSACLSSGNWYLVSGKYLPKSGKHHGNMRKILGKLVSGIWQ